MASYRERSPTTDSEREKFRKYVEKAGLLDLLTEVLTDLFLMEDKPDDVLKFVKTRLAAGPDVAQIDALKEEISILEKKIDTLEKENINLKLQLTDIQD